MLFIFMELVFASQLLGQTDTLNQKDASGKKQGKWIVYGADVVDSGVAPTGKVEEGIYVADQKIGPWIRYDKDGKTPNAIIYYAENSAGNNSNRIAFFQYRYTENGIAIVEPFPGDCAVKANQIIRYETGVIKEVTCYNTDCQESILVVAMDSISLTELPYFEITTSFIKKNEVGSVVSGNLINQPLNGFYLIDYNHTTFQMGLFKNGKLWNGKECILDENMNLISARLFLKGVYSNSYLLN